MEDHVSFLCKIKKSAFLIDELFLDFIAEIETLIKDRISEMKAICGNEAPLIKFIQTSHAPFFIK